MLRHGASTAQPPVEDDGISFVTAPPAGIKGATPGMTEYAESFQVCTRPAGVALPPVSAPAIAHATSGRAGGRACSGGHELLIPWLRTARSISGMQPTMPSTVDRGFHPKPRQRVLIRDAADGAAEPTHGTGAGRRPWSARELCDGSTAGGARALPPGGGLPAQRRQLQHRAGERALKSLLIMGMCARRSRGSFHTAPGRAPANPQP